MAPVRHETNWYCVFFFFFFFLETEPEMTCILFVVGPRESSILGSF